MEKFFTDGAYQAAGKAKILLNRSETAELEEYLKAEATTLSEQIVQPEGKEGVQAFLEKRKPSFPRADK